MASLTTDILSKELKQIYQKQPQIPHYDKDGLFSLPVFIIVGHSTYSLDIDKPLKGMEVPHHSFLCHPSPPGSYCLYAANLREEDDSHILKQSKEVIISSIFDKTKRYNRRINIVKENDEGDRVPSFIRGHYPGFFLPNSQIIDKKITFTDDGAPNPEDRGLLNRGYGVFKLDHNEERIDIYTQIGQYDRGNLFMKDIKKAGGLALSRKIKNQGELFTSEIMELCGPGIYIIMSCSELNLYNNDEAIDETDEVKLYRDVRYELNNYHKHFSQLWDSYCRRLNIVEFQPVNMSVQNQSFFSERKSSKLSKMGKRKKTKRTKNKQEKRRKKTLKK